MGFSIGSLKNLEYDRNAQPLDCERAIEVPLGRWFLEKFQNQAIEVGAVMPYHGANSHPVIDLCDDYAACVRVDALDVNYTGCNVLSLSTVEHVGFNEAMPFKRVGIPAQKEDAGAAVRCVEKIIRNARNYLLTWPVGFHKTLDAWAREHGRPRCRFMERLDVQGEWKECHADWALGREYGRPLRAGNAIVVLTNREEILNEAQGQAEPIRLNIGGGKMELPGFVTWDVKDGKPGYPLGVPDSSIEEIYASHVLEHWSHRETVAVLKDWHRALKPGGRLRVAVPDFDKAVKSYLHREPVPVEAFIMGGQVDAEDGHKALFTAGKLSQALTVAGFERVGPWTAEFKDCSALPISLNLQGFKPETVAAQPHVMPLARPKKDPARFVKAAAERPIPQITAIWSVPRLGFMDAFSSVFESLPIFGIKLVRGMGVFWGQQLERLAEHAIEKDTPEALLSVDYDAVFTPDDVLALIRLFQDHPEAAAVAAHQWNRAVDKALWTIDGRSEKSANPVRPDELTGDLFEVDTAHFGLTMLRVEALKKLPHPWFQAQPNPEGRWAEGRTDADIYFWRLMKSHGQRVFIAPQIVIGHLELAVRWPSPELSVVWQHMYDYHDRGRPPGVFGDNAGKEQKQ